MNRRTPDKAARVLALVALIAASCHDQAPTNGTSDAIDSDPVAPDTSFAGHPDGAPPDGYEDSCHTDCFGEVFCLDGVVWETPSGAAPCDIQDPCGPEYWTRAWQCESDGCGDIYCNADEDTFILEGDNVQRWSLVRRGGPSIRRSDGAWQISAAVAPHEGEDTVVVAIDAIADWSPDYDSDLLPPGSHAAVFPLREGDSHTVSIVGDEHELTEGHVLVITSGTRGGTGGPRDLPERGLLLGSTADGVAVAVLWIESSGFFEVAAYARPADP